ncbi:MOXD1 homolog 2 [Apis laboriosa]|uniref:MOXD1 homolog 2 n=2 Tax=Apis TaxID=7459 RepID=A0A7M7ILH0_APIME|nr:MOXD1 homolog 2 [Apis mellifera]XP_016771021.1 MOXD1 homolog 2 [Apis mellifera]XP_043803838.1 MOXD1 homolog 2 [Apis laboriosa]KAG6798060.1 MOXD1 2 [Apis mellifera caucasica]KAG9429894.1 MOXD1 2 [Apis mellifera carnica]|eukprot:XP_016771020.1 MOXD1 homolog 2 [Apis mellifera]
MKAVIATCLLLSVTGVLSVEWKHSAVLDNNFLVLWTPGERDVMFEIQVKTLGYVGLGFTRDDGTVGADMVIGWVDNNGQLHLQDRHVKNSSKDPQMDSSQDYCLLLGYENKTHTVLRFSRRYDTCDPRDLKITNDTMQVVWQYHVEEPVSAAGVLPDHDAIRGSRPLYLVQRDAQPRPTSRNQEAEPPLQTWDILNQQVRLPKGQDTLLWCRVLRMPNIDHKHHVVKHEPVIQPGSHDYLHHMTLYECRGDQGQLESAAKTSGSVCYQSNQPSLQCNTIAAIWSLGSEGFNYPAEAGYALDPHTGPRYYMLETHYANPQMDAFISDSSGLRLHYTDKLRTHDAGILSVGIDPNWRHIIPPGQAEVVSEGHCISDCTGHTIPNSGINIFAVIMHTHQLGRKVRLRQIRSGEELPPIASDTNYDPSYQEYRKLQKPVRVYPGDHLVAECTYSSKSRQAITLGGLTTREETCLVSTLYYPRIELSLCYSLPSLPTVLQSLGIQKLMQGSSPVKIQEPQKLAGMTLEERLLSYDWESSFQSFQEATRGGTFKPLCWTNKGELAGMDSLEVHYPRILRPYEEVALPCSKKPLRNKLSLMLSEDEDIGAPVDPDSDETNAVERGQLVRSKVSRSSDGPTGGSSSTRSIPTIVTLATLAIIVTAAFR